MLRVAGLETGEFKGGPKNSLLEFKYLKIANHFKNKSIKCGKYNLGNPHFWGGAPQGVVPL